MPTLLDRLACGASPDLRDARLLAWLFDPTGEHGLGRAMLIALGSCMADKGKKALSRLLASQSPPPFDTGVRLREGQVEVIITTMGKDMVGVWRTRAHGYAGELEVLASQNIPAIGIASAADVFPAETTGTFPIFTWVDVVRVLDDTGPQDGATSEGAGLVVSFRESLRSRLR